MSSLTNLFTDIANAIRSKKGSTGLIKATDFASEIMSLSSNPTTTITVISSTTTGTNSNTQYIDSYGTGFDSEGRLIIWVKSNDNNYENICFLLSDSSNGTKYTGYDVAYTSFKTSAFGPVFACITDDLSEYSSLDITLDVTTRHSSYDVLQITVIITGK